MAKDVRDDDLWPGAGIEQETCMLAGLTIRNGHAEYDGGICGGTKDAHSRATIAHNAITGNSAEQAGGGLCFCDGKIYGNAITQNAVGGGSAGSGGGLAYCNGDIRSNVITGNSARGAGGLGGCDGTIVNNLVAGNSVTASGVGLSFCDGTVQNTTIAGNSCGYRGPAMYSCLATIRNCIIWGNQGAGGAQLVESTLPTYSCVQGLDRGEGNIAVDPGFVDAIRRDYRLSADSPCVDSGLNEDWMWQAVDLDGNSRIWRGRDSWTVDMGAYEYGSWPFRIADVAAMGDGAEIVWNSRPDETYMVWSCSDLTTAAWVEDVAVLSQGQTTLWTDLLVGNSRQKFYRIQIVQ